LYLYKLNTADFLTFKLKDEANAFVPLLTKATFFDVFLCQKRLDYTTFSYSS